MTKKFFSYFLLTCLAFTLTACGGDDGITNGTEDSAAIDQDEDQTKATIDDDYIYKLPVIFHVLYKNKSKSTEYVNAERLKTILNNVNELYKGNIYGESQDIKVQFVLATHDEKGNKLSTPGVEYVQWTEEYPISQNDFMSDNTRTKVKYIWDPNEYINIMIYNFKESDTGEVTLGVSHTPYSIESDNPLEGLETVPVKYISKSQLSYPYCLSINSLYINSESSRYTTDKGKDSYTYRSDDINVTLAHELGHYLGIFHPFTEKDNETVDECEDTDYCTDTPSYNRIAYESTRSIYLSAITDPSKINILALFERSNCDNLSFSSCNIMDYDFCFGYELTANQKERMRHVLYYSPLISGPKKNGANKSSASNIRSRSGADETLDLPIRFMR